MSTSIFKGLNVIQLREKNIEMFSKIKMKKLYVLLLTCSDVRLYDQNFQLLFYEQKAIKSSYF